MEARKGVNYKIVGDAGRSRWVHHDDLMAWKTMQKEDGVLTGNDGGREVVGDSAVTEEVAQQVSCSETSSEGSDLEGEEELAVRARPRRNRRKPFWMKDYVS